MRAPDSHPPTLAAGGFEPTTAALEEKASEASARPEPPPRADSAIPAWFKARRERLAKAEAERTAEEQAIVIHVSTDVVERPWPERFHRWIFSRHSAAYVLSLLVHLFALIALSVAIVQHSGGDGGINTIFVTQGDENQQQPGFDDPIDVQVGFDGGHTATTTALVPIDQFIGDRETATVRDLTAFAMQGQGHGEGEGEQTGDGTAGGGFRMPAPGRTVVKGNFTVWTVPDDPDPGVPYEIVIQVKLPKKGKLRWGDVSGLVVGTDGYEQRISQYSKHTRYITRANQVVVRVPGARNKVRDHIQVRSNMLQESQTLEIVF